MRRNGLGAHKGVREGGVGGVAVGHRVDAIAKVEARLNANAILAIGDALAGGEDVDVCAFRTEFAVTLSDNLSAYGS